ncbi:MAG: hypothetical protein ABR538_09690, partial [Candidatus Binatia bacterium]
MARLACVDLPALPGLAVITEVLRAFTPHVEPSAEEAGVFWLDAGGLGGLYADLGAWGRAVLRALRAKGFEGRLVAGFTRFGTYALARGMAPGRGRGGARGLLVCESEEEERRFVRDVRLERLGLAPALLGALARLGVHTVGAFAALPADGIRRRFARFGRVEDEAWRLHRRARGEAFDPLVPLAAPVSLVRSLLLDDPVGDTGIVLFVVRRLLAELIAVLAARDEAVRGVRVRLHRNLRRDGPSIGFEVQAAEATLEEAVLTDLVRLRLETLVRREIGGASSVLSILEIEVEVEAAAAGHEQLRLFRERTRRDLGAAARAMARVCAELGEGSVVRAVLRQGHLPEAGYRWEAAESVAAPSPRLVLTRPLVRRIYEQPVALPPKPFRERDDCWIASVVAEGVGGGGGAGRGG